MGWNVANEHKGAVVGTMGTTSNNLASFYYSSTPDAQAVGKIAEGLNEQERLLQSLHEELGSLEVRLSALLRPTHPTPPGDGMSAPSAAQSHVGSALATFNGETARALLRVRELSARIDM